MKSSDYQYIRNLSMLFLLVLLVACGGNSKRTEAQKKALEEVEQDTEVKPAISKEVLADIVKSIPSPLEISFLIKEPSVKVP